MNWEYKVIWARQDEGRIPEELNNNGQAGWDLVAVTEVNGMVTIYFKRPLIVEKE